MVAHAAVEDVEVMDYDEEEQEQEIAVTPSGNVGDAANGRERTPEEVSSLFARFPIQGQFAQ